MHGQGISSNIVPDPGNLFSIHAVLICMTPHPFKNATAAALYIALIISGIFMSEEHLSSVEDTIFMPMMMLGLLVLSVATMAFLFFAEPLRLLGDGKSSDGMRFFLKTLGVFALYVLLAIALTFFFSYR